MTAATALDAPLSALAQMVIARQLQRLRSHENGTRTGADPDELHDMRVATRRLRAALRLFQTELPQRPAVRLRRELAWLGHALGAVRDLDVQLQRLDAWSQEGHADTISTADASRAAGWSALAAILTRQHATARRKLLRVFASQRYARLLDGMDRFVARLTRLTHTTVSTPVRVGAPALLLHRYERVRARSDALTPASSADELHALRIACKRLRYALEFHAEAYGDGLLERLPALIALQDLLGAHQDAVVAQTQLAEWIQHPALHASAASQRGLQQAQERNAAMAADARARLPALNRELGADRWAPTRRLLLEHARPQAAAP